MRPVSHKLLMDMRFMHKCGTCKTIAVSVGEVIQPVCVMASSEPSVVCSGIKCDGSGVIEDNIKELEVI